MKFDIQLVNEKIVNNEISLNILEIISLFYSNEFYFKSKQIKNRRLTLAYLRGIILSTSDISDEWDCLIYIMEQTGVQE